jgi:hypothetical protein
VIKLPSGVFFRRVSLTVDLCLVSLRRLLLTVNLCLLSLRLICTPGAAPLDCARIGRHSRQTASAAVDHFKGRAHTSRPPDLEQFGPGCRASPRVRRLVSRVRLCILPCVDDCLPCVCYPLALIGQRLRPPRARHILLPRKRGSAALQDSGSSVGWSDRTCVLSGATKLCTPTALGRIA